METNSTNFVSKEPVDHFITFFETIGIIADPYLTPIEVTIKSTFKSSLPSLYENVSKFMEKNQSPLSARLPLMNPFHVLLITIAYLLTIYFGKIFMSRREKLNVRILSIFHNLFLVSLSSYMFLSITFEAWKNGYSLFANPEVRSEEGFQMAKYVWLFYVSKISEFMDTFIMVLKKNNHQISFLHVYHHFSIFMIWWFVTFVAPNGESYFSAALNSLVHVIMYGYYLSTTLSFPIRFLKRYITQFQMTQFIMMMVQATYDIIHFKVLRPEEKNTYPFSLTALLWVYMVTMLALFANFYKADRKREKVAKSVGDKKSL
ncbi:unnamed protein product [Rhizophagus irregularis]|uniref:Elongation of fatty acids protein n=1 Tax=Rhizophagus irregularis TaxID=588596 RepID=A0A2N1NV79_9GLOM|nr:delta-6 elongase [Rhizophagus irregularis]CAB4398927.1 unnamed protein product [Rhizophagus irregularis]CAB5364383.1 unnamed protein product [Rhizophagus irregularis]